MKGLLKLIQERQSLRGPFDPNRPVAKQDLMQVLEAGRWTPTAHNMQNFEIIVVDDKKLLQAIGKIKSPISETFIRENYQQLSFSEEELLRKKVGILGTMFPPAMRTPGAKLDKATDKKMASRFGSLVQTSPVLLIVLYDPNKRAPASEGDFLGIISLGCLMENMWLMASSLGIGFHILSFLGSDPVEKEVKRILNIPKHFRIAYAVRMGYPPSPPATSSKPAKPLRVRRDIPTFTHHNRFGNKGIE
jgi:nitroreductase